jgi:hypothetical protein
LQQAKVFQVFDLPKRRLIQGKNIAKTQFLGAKSIKEMPCRVNLG